MKIEEYLRKEISEGKIDFSVRATINDGRLEIYIHPTGKDGNTVDFIVSHNEFHDKKDRKVMVCGVDCHRGDENCNGYCEGKASMPPRFVHD